MRSLTGCRSIRTGLLTLVLTATPLALEAQGNSLPYANFEASQTNPIRLSADQTRLFAVNTANSSVSVFDVTTPSSPSLIVEIPVGLGPVSVNPLTDDVAWVVNQISNSISVISVAKGIVTNTIYLKLPTNAGLSAGEPMDVVFANGLAYVSVSRAHQIAVLSATTGVLAQAIEVFGDSPRAMAVSPDGSTIYAALALAGNGTTLIPNTIAPAQCGTSGQPQCVPPMNPDLPPPPIAGLIVNFNNTTWNPSFIKFSMPQNGVVAITPGSSSNKVSYYSQVGTVNLGLAVNPTTGDIWRFRGFHFTLSALPFVPN